MALTIDDGTDSRVVKAYIDLAKATGIRLTFFVTAAYPSWTEHRDDLRPLVDSGQIQLGNHTWDHPDLRSKSARDVASQLNRCETFLHTTFGVTAKPFVRPPYGFHTAQTDAAASAAGFGTMVLWLGSLGDSSRLTCTARSSTSCGRGPCKPPPSTTPSTARQGDNAPSGRDVPEPVGDEVRAAVGERQRQPGRQRPPSLASSRFGGGL